MKKNIRKSILLCMMLLFGAALPCSVAASVQTTPILQEDVIPTPTVEATPTPKPVRNGWFTKKNGRKFYYINGKKVTGLKKINGKYYYFHRQGSMLTGWKKLEKGKSYFNKKGVRVTGVRKIDGKYYYFSKHGLMRTGTVRDGKVTYYLDDKGRMEARKKGTQYYRPNGKAMTQVKARDYDILLKAREILARITTPKMSKSQKLKTCFDWVIRHPYVTRRGFTSQEGWPAIYADDIFSLGGGNCMSDASAFAYLARAIGYKEVYVCADALFNSAHAWAEIGGKVYDPLFAEAKNYNNNYAASYGVYILHPVQHIKIS